MKYIFVTCTINGVETTLPVSEDEILKAYAEYVIRRVTTRIADYMQLHHADAVLLYGNNYERVLRRVAYDMLDYFETEGLDESCLTEELIREFVEMHITPYRKLSTVLYPNGDIVVYAARKLGYEDHEVVRVSNGKTIYSDDAERDFLDVLRAAKQIERLSRLK